MKTAAHRGKTPSSTAPSHEDTSSGHADAGLRPAACPPRSHYNSLHNANNISASGFCRSGLLRACSEPLEDWAKLGEGMRGRRRCGRSGSMLGAIFGLVPTSVSRHPERR